MTNSQRKMTARVFYAGGVLVSLATFLLHLLAVNWGIFLSSAAFIIGSLFWPGWDGVNDGKNTDTRQR